MEIDDQHSKLIHFIIQRVPKLNDELQEFLRTEKWSKDKRHSLINCLVQNLLQNDSFTSTISDDFQQLFPVHFIAFIQRLSTAVNSSTKVISQVSIKQRFLVLLARLIPHHPCLKTLTENQLQSNSVSLIEWNETSPRKKLKTKESNPRNDFHLLLATLRILLFSNSKADSIPTWKWKTLFYLMNNSTDEEVKWLAFLCLSIVLNLPPELQDSYRPTVSNQTIIKVYNLINPRMVSLSNLSMCDQLFVEDDFKKRTVFIGGIPLAKSNSETKDKESIELTRTETVEKSLREIALSISMGWTTLIFSPISNGKTMIVEYLSEQVNQRLIKIQCSDHMDSKVLLGTYQCTDKPGEFIWTPGLLVEATTEGHWLLMEDIDAASSDVISTIKTLIETSSIGHGSVSPNFRLFLTQRDTGIPVQSNELIHLLKNVFCTVIPVYSDTEILQIMESLPIWNDDLKLFQTKLFEFYQNLRIAKGSSHSRLVTLRDLLKCCRRLSKLSLSSSTDRQLAFYDVLDCFISFHPKAQRQIYLQSVGTLFNMNQQETEFYAFKSTAELNENDKSYFSIGHIKLEIQKKNQSGQPQYCFAKTRTALFSLERIARCVQMNEPVLLCGETGGGKTTLVQYLAQKTGNRLHVINLSQQSDSVDLLGGYKPYDSTLVVKQIFRDFSYEQTNNEWIEQVQKSIQAKKYKEAVKLMIKYTESNSTLKIQLLKLRESLKSNSKSALLFRFVEGSLVQALRNGDWILLDEINLASSETLQLLSGILESSQGTIWLAERGDKQPIVRHENFRLFGCMNPASDVGKRDIPIGIRNRFTEFYVDEIDDRAEFLIIVDKYLSQTNIPREYIDRIVNFYFEIQSQVKSFQITSSSTSSNRISVTYSLRTLCRALKYVATTQWSGKSFARSLFEGFCLSFFSQLDRSYYEHVQKLIHKIILKENPSIEILLKTSQMVVSKEQSRKFIEIRNFFVLKGEESIHTDESYIFTKTVEENLQNIIRVLSAKSYPILLQGETSVGKTSLIHWLASATGNKCVRINNHEHTDLSEYLGTYTCSSVNGQLVFQDGPLIKAMRYGWWIILDELNLASSDILEALNRLLDDNRQLYLSETNELINAHERFQLFATQNPAGEQYAGRKRLSRAFRNRFIELHFDNLPQKELETIIEKKCRLPKSYSKLLIQTMVDLQKHRSQKGIFAGKSSLITLRDLFRWAQRYSKWKDSCDNYKQFLGEHGYLLLAGRSRLEEDRLFIRQTLEKYFCEKKFRIDENILFSEEGSPFSTGFIWKQIQQSNQFQHIVWTQPLRRLAVLAGLSLFFDEPALLVGETGCGKTTVCEILSKMNGQQLFTVNCHTTTESSDFLGSIRPMRRNENELDQDEKKGLFEWQDGALVTAMKQGGLFLIDEISLADDSVLERLNSVLEPEKQLVLAEKGYQDDQNQIDIVRGHSNFRLVATMNPGGDFGKKELSPALRNRLTEIWCTPSQSIDDFRSIIIHNLKLNEEQDRSQCAEMMCRFIEMLRSLETIRKFLITVRDLLSWISFINLNPSNWRYSYEQGAYLVFVDAIESQSLIKQSICYFLLSQRQEELICHSILQLGCDRLTIGSYSIPLGEHRNEQVNDYSFQAPTTLINVERLVRAMQLNTKPILIEGNPGVGKTSLVISLAKLTGHAFIRINLSEQTDISDLFGSDLPDVESGDAGKFRWHDGPLLRAIKENQWIILDELNLANQSVLEGLNACLDHRGEIYIPELNRRFLIHQRENVQPLRIFACQNPYGQVGGRKGLPKSFLNRFTTIYFSVLQRVDLRTICRQMFPKIDEQTLEQMLNFHELIQTRFPSSQWEFNLRDLLKWCQVIEEQSDQIYSAFDLIYLQRLRTDADRTKMKIAFEEATSWPIETIPIEFHLDSKVLRIGSTSWKREMIRLSQSSSLSHRLIIMRHQIGTLNSILKCLSLSWPILLVGPSSKSSKTTLIKILSSLTGHRLNTFEMNSSIDTNELLGTYEQFNFQQFAKYSLKNLRDKSKISSIEEKFDWSKREITVELLNELKEIFDADEIDKIISKSTKDQHFVWVESILLRSMRLGHWLILENVNQCSLSVLDRLNSLLEPNGELILNEGGGQCSLVKAHKDFRLILSMDHRQGQGEISRPMRNRCCELFIDDKLVLSNELDLQDLVRASNVESPEIFVEIHRALSEKASTFGLETLIRCCSSFNELRRLSSAEAFRSSVKMNYRTLNSRVNQEIDRFVDEFHLDETKQICKSESTAVFVDDLSLQPEFVLALKRNQSLWSTRFNEQPRNFEILFFRFLENICSPSIEFDLFREKCAERKDLLDLIERFSVVDNPLLRRVLVEFDFAFRRIETSRTGQRTSQEEFLFFHNGDKTFWNEMFDFIVRRFSKIDLNDKNYQFEHYNRWRSLHSIVVDSSSSISRRVRLIVLWTKIREFFFSAQDEFSRVERFDRDFLLIQQEFMEFYRIYQSTMHRYFFDELEYQMVCRRNDLFDRIDLFRQTTNFVKLLRLWVDQEDKLTDLIVQLDDEKSEKLSILDELEKCLSCFSGGDSTIDEEIFFFKTFEPICFFRFFWLKSLSGEKLESTPFPLLKIALEVRADQLEFENNLMICPTSSTIEQIYRRDVLAENSSRSLLFFFNDKSRRVSMGAFRLVERQKQRLTEFLRANGRFIGSDRFSLKTFVEKSFSVSFNDELSITRPFVADIFGKLRSMKPRGQIDPVLYRRIIENDEKRFVDEISSEKRIRNETDEKFSFSLNFTRNPWQKQIEQTGQIDVEPKEKEILRPNNEIYENLIETIEKSLFGHLLNESLIFDEIFEKNNEKFYVEWRRNLFEFYRRVVLSEKFYVYRDVTMPLLNEIFRFVLLVDFHFESIVEKRRHENRILPVEFVDRSSRENFLESSMKIFERRSTIKAKLDERRSVEIFHKMMEFLYVSVVLSGSKSKKSEELLIEYFRLVSFLWSEEKRKADEEQALSNSIFRHELSLTETEEEDQLFLSFFPPIDATLNSFLDQESTGAEQVESKAPVDRARFSLFFELFRSFDDFRRFDADRVFSSFFSSFYNFGENLRLIDDSIRVSMNETTPLADFILNERKSFDVFRDGRPSLVVPAIDVLDRIERKTRHFLTTHENHPTLNEMLVLVRRIKSFSVHNSIVQFLVGFEILLEKIHFWQKTFGSARLETKFDEENVLLTEKIVELRRFEYSCHEQTLSIVDFNIRQETIERFCFHVFHVLDENCPQTNADEHKQQTEQFFTEFFSNSTVGDFRFRLEICRVLLGHFRNEISRRVAAVFSFFEQFESFVNEQIDRTRRSIETQLKEFFQIQRWKDTNFYSLKQSIDKSQRIIFKSIRNYRKKLNEPSAQLLQTYRVDRDFELNENDEFARSIRLKVNKIHFSSLDQVRRSTREICRSSKLVRTNSSTSQDAKQRKFDLNVKKQILTKIFDNLTSIGLNFRKGILGLNSKKSRFDDDIDFPAFELEFSPVYGTLRSKRKTFVIEQRRTSTEKLCQVFRRSNEDFQRIVFQRRQIDRLAEKAKVDAVFYERIRGFDENLIETICRQRHEIRFLAENFRDLNEILIDFSGEDRSIDEFHGQEFDELRRINLSIIERIESFRLLFRTIFDSSKSESSTSAEHFLRELESEHRKIGEISDRAERRRLEKHSDLALIEQIRGQIDEQRSKVEEFLVKTFLDESSFPNDRFGADLTKNLIELYRRFFEIKFVRRSAEKPTKTDEGKNFKKIRRDFRQTFNELRPNELGSSERWLNEILDRLVELNRRFNFERLKTFFSKTLTDKRRAFLVEILGFIEEFLYRVAFFHRASIELYFSLSQTWVPILDGLFQQQEQQSEQDNDQQQTQPDDSQQVSGFDNQPKQDNAKDVSEQIETEDQLEENKTDDQQEQQEQENVDAEKDAIEIADDLPGEGQENADDEDRDSQQSDDEDIEEQAGKVEQDEQQEMFDDKKWKEEQERDQEEEEEEEQKPEQSDEANGDLKEREDVMKAREENLELDEQDLDEHRQNVAQEENPEEKEENDDPDDKMELPENIKMDGDEDQEENEGQENDDEQKIDDINQIEDFEKDKNEPGEDENENQQRKPDLIEEPPENLDEEENLQENEDSALTKDKKPMENAESIEEKEKNQEQTANTENLEKKQNSNEQTAGESSSNNDDKDKEQISSSKNQNVVEKNQEKRSEMQEKDNSSNKTNENRTLAETNSSMEEKMDAAVDLEHVEDTIDDGNEQDKPDEQKTFGHAANLKEISGKKKEIIDSATEDQRNQKQMERSIEEQNEPTPMDVDEPQKEQDRSKLDVKEKLKENLRPKDSNEKNSSIEQQNEIDKDTKSVEKDFVRTSNVENRVDFLVKFDQQQKIQIEQVEHHLERWYNEHLVELDRTSNDDRILWNELELLTQPFVFELCEQLRLLLEPTLRSKYSGDFRTGKRLNMKRIIPYIASDFRKDRIWLRRSKPSKRQYQLILAIDDSQSMDNLKVKRLALESLILIGQTLNLLDIGQFGIVSFGQKIEFLQTLNQSFSQENGIDILKRLKFEQTQTLLAELMESVIYTFVKEKQPIASPLSQLLIILSDGRGLTVSGKDRLLRSVRHAMSLNIFLVFVILDNSSDNKSTSIFQINEAVFLGEKVEFRPYLDSFPFPYYLVIQNVEMLPRALIDVLRQFLELTTTNNNNSE